MTNTIFVVVSSESLNSSKGMGAKAIYLSISCWWRSSCSEKYPQDCISLNHWRSNGPSYAKKKENSKKDRQVRTSITLTIRYGNTYLPAYIICRISFSSNTLPIVFFGILPLLIQIVQNHFVVFIPDL